LNDKKRILSCVAWLDGEYGIKGTYAGVPCVIGEHGVEKVIELPLEPKEKGLFDASIKTVQKLIEATRPLL